MKPFTELTPLTITLYASLNYKTRVKYSLFAHLVGYRTPQSHQIKGLTTSLDKLEVLRITTQIIFRNIPTVKLKHWYILLFLERSIMVLNPNDGRRKGLVPAGSFWLWIEWNERAGVMVTLIITLILHRLHTSQETFATCYSTGLFQDGWRARAFIPCYIIREHNYIVVI